jgi:hypothetical protein
MAKKQAVEANYEEDLDCIDFNNYKGIFFEDEPGRKYQDEVTGAHFEYGAMCRRLRLLQKELQEDPQTLESSADERSENLLENDLDSSSKRAHIHDSNQGFKALQAMLIRSQVKDSRNVVQSLPQQGYSTTGLKQKEPTRTASTIANNCRQFSSHIDTRQPKHESKPTAAQLQSVAKADVHCDTNSSRKSPFRQEGTGSKLGTRQALHGGSMGPLAKATGLTGSVVGHVHNRNETQDSNPSLFAL